MIFFHNRLVFLNSRVCLLTEIGLDVHQAIVFRSCWIDVLLIRTNDAKDVIHPLDDLISDGIDQLSFIAAVLFQLLVYLEEQSKNVDLEDKNIVILVDRIFT